MICLPALNGCFLHSSVCARTQGDDEVDDVAHWAGTTVAETH